MWLGVREMITIFLAAGVGPSEMSQARAEATSFLETEENAASLFRKNGERSKTQLGEIFLIGNASKNQRTREIAPGLVKIRTIFERNRE